MYALPVTYGSNDLRSAPQPRAPQSTVAQLRQSDDPFARPIVLITMATYMANAFTKKQIDSLNELFNIFLAPPAPAGATIRSTSSSAISSAAMQPSTIRATIRATSPATDICTCFRSILYAITKC